MSRVPIPNGLGLVTRHAGRLPREDSLSDIARKVGHSSSTSLGPKLNMLVDLFRLALLTTKV